jgi:hypothetical protein
MPRVAEHLVGRAAEVGAVDRAIHGLEGGVPPTILPVGEPGRLVERAMSGRSS